MSSQNVPIGALPELGDVPDSMFAQVIRSERMGDPRDAFVVEEIGVPVPGPNDVLIAVMAAGVNFNNVWAAKGVPIDVIKVRQKRGDAREYHIGGSDASATR
jgi:crotonyl-CoA carboxylase/reductase